MRRYVVALAALAPVALGAVWWGGGLHGEAGATRELLSEYCTDCHNESDFTADLVIEPAGIDAIAADPEHWEKVVRKLRSEEMPPDGPRPPHEQYLRAATFLEGELDAAAAALPQPGDVPAFRRLTRTEYRNAIRDLLALDDLPAELDFALLLPADNAASGFDNIADLLFISPVVMERYIAAAQKIARVAVGDLRAPVMVNIHQLSEQLPQDERIDGLSFGTRGGLDVRTYLPLDAEYVVELETAGAVPEPHEIELSVDGVRVAVTTVVTPEGARRSSEHVTFRAPLAAGPHLLGITFVERSEALDESITRGRMRGRGALPAIAMATIRGPYAATGPGETPSRERIFVCRPGEEAAGSTREPGAEQACATEILRNLARRAYRRPPTDADVADLLSFFEMGRADEGMDARGRATQGAVAERSFDAGIQFALERLLVSPQFLYRVEREPAEAGAFRVSDFELASRLSFFLWSSIPDDELLDAAERGSLREPGVLAAQVQRMLADPRSEAMVTNFAAQWLYLRDVAVKDPDIFLFPDHDVSLRAALERETELFVDSVLRSGGSVLDLLTAKHTFVNERLAKHYGIPHVQGSYFRRIELGEDTPRAGLLGQGSVLTVTSYATRTSPVLRGKYVLDNLLASPPPPPPPDVPSLATEDEEGGAPLTLREAMIRHRANPACASCHAKMDPIGFALEHFDAVGRWRDEDAGVPIESKSELVDGTVIDGPAGVQAMLTSRPELFVGALTEKLLMYALGRNVQYYDAPAVRGVVRAAATRNYEFSAIVEGIVASVPFQMRAGSGAASAAVAATEGQP